MTPEEFQKYTEERNRWLSEDDPIKYLSAFLQDNPPSGGGAK